MNCSGIWGLGGISGGGETTEPRADPKFGLLARTAPLGFDRSALERGSEMEFCGTPPLADFHVLRMDFRTLLLSFSG